MGLLRAHLAAVAIVVAAVLAMTGVFVFARPKYHPYQMPKPPNDGLGYTNPKYTAADALRVFAKHGLRLVPGMQTGPIKGFHTRDETVLVDVFGARDAVDAEGFSDYYTFVNGKWYLAPKNCSSGAKSAERWRGNVRLIVYCTAAQRLVTAATALAALP
jgi:hypothetical protein